jgi:lecithin:cholesterol acyltransferase
MEAIILVHGIKGAVLSLGSEIVWPPTIQEAIFGYGRIDKLLDPACAPSGIIDSVGCFPVYQGLNDDLSTICNEIGAQKEVFVYDWRLDIYNKTADALVHNIEQLANSGATAITLVCHSMGGLIGRLLLESGTYSNKPWFPKIKRFIGICSPNLGAPIALSQCLGLESSEGVSGSDLKRFAADPRYPSGYQLLPAPLHNALYDDVGKQWLDIYDHGVDAAIGLNAQNVDLAKTTFGYLDLGKRPANVDYVLISGSGHSTEQIIELEGPNPSQVIPDDAGDGTVPLWSADSSRVSHYVKPGDHIGILNTYPFRQTLYSLLAGRIMMSMRFLAAQPTVTVSINKRTFAPNEQISVILVPDTEAREISGTLKLSRAADPDGHSLVEFGTGQAVAYRGPPISRLRLTLTAPSQPGAYRLAFEGTHATDDGTAAHFVVSRMAGAQGRPPI